MADLVLYSVNAKHCWCYITPTNMPTT